MKNKNNECNNVGNQSMKNLLDKLKQAEKMLKVYENDLLLLQSGKKQVRNVEKAITSKKHSVDNAKKRIQAIKQDIAKNSQNTQNSVNNAVTEKIKTVKPLRKKANARLEKLYASLQNSGIMTDTITDSNIEKIAKKIVKANILTTYKASGNPLNHQFYCNLKM